MVTDLPLIRREMIARTFRPASTASDDAALKTLRTNKCLTAGVPVALRGAQGGRLQGKVVLYAALNRDAALLARAGLSVDARRLAAAATKLETGAVVRRIKASLEARASDSSEFPAFLYSALRESEQLRRDIAQLAGQIAKIRERFPALNEGETVISGHLQTRNARVAELSSDDGELLALPAQQLADWAVTVGSPLVLHSQSLGNGAALFQVVPGVEVREAEAVAAPSASPFESPMGQLPAEVLADMEEMQRKEISTITPAAPIGIIRKLR